MVLTGAATGPMHYRWTVGAEMLWGFGTVDQAWPRSWRQSAARSS